MSLRQTALTPVSSSFMSWRSCFDTVQPMDASEVVAESLPGTKGGMLVISQSGA